LLKQRARLDAELERYQRMVTVMFTDIAGSTRYFDEHGDLAGMAMLQEVNDTLQPRVGEHKGIIVKTIGDAIMAYFENPIEGVRCGIDMQRAIEKANNKRSEAQQIRVRVALNLGVGLLKDNDVFGDVVNVCSRIEHETQAEKIGVSPSVVEAVGKEKDVACQKIGEVAMRGKAKPMDLYEVLWRPEEIEEFKKAPPKKMSGEQLAMATGTRLGLDDEVRKGTGRRSSQGDCGGGEREGTDEQGTGDRKENLHPGRGATRPVAGQALPAHRRDHGGRPREGRHHLPPGQPAVPRTLRLQHFGRCALRGRSGQRQRNLCPHSRTT
jgi:class 3 adenylate cyclase